MWGSHSWGDIIQGDFFHWCMAMENLICDVDENLWPDQQERQDDHQEYFFSWMLFCICGYIVSMKCTVIGQARFHFTCNTFVQKHMYCINTINNTKKMSMYYWLFSTNIRFFLWNLNFHDWLSWWKIFWPVTRWQKYFIFWWPWPNYWHDI